MTFSRLIAACLPPMILLAITAGQNTPAPQLTFNRDVAPIVFRTCAACHHPGGAGPFSLLSYADAKAHARQIATVTRTHFMPPWLPEPGDLKFADDLRLSDQEIATIQKWQEQGAVEGSPSDLPAAPQFSEGWELGKPDVVLTARKPFMLPAERYRPVLELHPACSHQRDALAEKYRNQAGAEASGSPREHSCRPRTGFTRSGENSGIGFRRNGNQAGVGSF